MEAYESDDDLWSGEVRHVDIGALPAPLPHNKTAAAEPGQSADTDAAVAREVAAFLLQRRCIYKDKFYRGLVTVDTTATNGLRIVVSMVVEPLPPEVRRWRITMNMPARAVRADALGITLDIGYGVGGILVHDAEAVSAIEAMFRRGASGQETLDAINHCIGLPAHVAARRYRPLPASCTGSE